MSDDRDIAGLKERFHLLKHLLDTDWRFRRCWAAAEALVLGRGGRAVVAKLTGLSRVTLNAAVEEVTRRPKELAKEGRILRAAPGRPRMTESDEQLPAALIALLEPRGRNRNSPLRWSLKSTRRLANELTENGHPAAFRSVAALLDRMGFALVGRHKSRKAGADRDRDRQFRKVSSEVSRFVKCGLPVVVLNLKTRKTKHDVRTISSWRQALLGAEQRQLHDRQQTALEKVLPGAATAILDHRRWTKAAIDQATARFAARSLRAWWSRLGCRRFKRKTLLVVADINQSGQQAELLEVELKRQANVFGLTLRLLFLPPGTSRWDSVAQRLVVLKTRHRRGRHEVTQQAVMTAITRKQTSAEPVVRVALDDA